MLKNISNLGKTLNKAELKTINGGKIQCDRNRDGVCEQTGFKCAELYCQLVALPF